jgi:hypothetical protein
MEKHKKPIRNNRFQKFHQKDWKTKNLSEMADLEDFNQIGTAQ